MDFGHSLSTLSQGLVMYGADNQVVEAQNGPLSRHVCWVIDQDKLGLIRTHELFCKITGMYRNKVDKEFRRRNPTSFQQAV